MNLALFDFDGTITKKDTMIDFLCYVFPLRKCFVCAIRLFPALLGYAFGAVSDQIAKEKIIDYFFKGKNVDWLNDKAIQYAKNRLPKLIRQSAFKQLMWHRHQGDRIIIVTASIENWVKPWCDSYGFELIATKLEIDQNNCITGRFATKNCKGIEKVTRIMQVVNKKDFDRIFAYGDSDGDKEMLELADEKYVRWFK